ncbi:hypothetical protein ABDJ41_19885 [Pedobacter sp. ASV1-7]|uniref:hypothetical protein n=1 Tax=Pedobacter sp. ASV1-7 TaxID=3145237 RepID=UPI0032E85F87
MNIKFLKKIPAVVLLPVVIISCEQKIKTKNPIDPKPIKEPVTILATPPVKSIPLPATLTIEKITAAQFNTASQQEKVSKPLEKITDFNTVQKLLTGVVDFKEMDSRLRVSKINFRNGSTSGNNDQLEDCTFVAYFPSEDILLLEGGHTIDVSFDLKTGQKTYDAGNPDLVSTSPGGKYRLNKVFEGQECFYHFIQEKKNGKFQKVFELDQIFKKKYNKWLCVIEKGFWTADDIFYFREVIQYKETGNTYEYYKVKITQAQ